ncbi:hypothetical protein IMSHALPRED_003457 [Imshaugia aleurites]|uniref:DASH complex subunit DAD1 n=1 Tax=Imshaugia aleurites TaxID=172621 RepID=A0A8H3PJB6_9LECA|nr:hypothetical protein IMSHALPRED_003457 [Imshaugia aleurites]
MASRPTTQQPQTAPKSSFFQQRDALVGEIAVSLENVLQNMNKLNRSLEGVIAVGNEFGAVEALWSQFEGVMAQEAQEEGKEGSTEGSGEEEEEIEGAGVAEKGDEKGRGR